MIEAITKADAEARARQAAQQPSPEEQQPGLAQPGMGAEAAPAAPGLPPADRMQQLLGALQGPAQQVTTRIGR